MKILNRSILFYLLFGSAIFQISSCKKDVTPVNAFTPFQPKEYTIDLNYIGTFYIKYNEDYLYYLADHCSSWGVGDVNISGKNFNANITFNQRYDRVYNELFTRMLIGDNMNSRDYIIFSNFNIIFPTLQYSSGVAAFDGTCNITEGFGKFATSIIKTEPLKVTGTADTLNHELQLHLTGKIFY